MLLINARNDGKLPFERRRIFLASRNGSGEQSSTVRKQTANFACSQYSAVEIHPMRELKNVAQLKNSSSFVNLQITIMNGPDVMPTIPSARRLIPKLAPIRQREPIAESTAEHLKDAVGTDRKGQSSIGPCCRIYRNQFPPLSIRRLAIVSSSQPMRISGTELSSRSV